MIRHRNDSTAFPFAAIIAEACPVPHDETLAGIGERIEATQLCCHGPSYYDRLQANKPKEDTPFPASLLRNVLKVKAKR